MQRLEIIDPVLARRCKFAQFLGQLTRLRVNGAVVTGNVLSIGEDVSSTDGPRWIVSIVPNR